MTEIRKCLIKVIVNPVATVSVNIRFERLPTTNVYIKLSLHTVDHLQLLINEIKSQLREKYYFNVTWNFAHVPNSIKDNVAFRDEMMKIFSINDIYVTNQQERILPQTVPQPQLYPLNKQSIFAYLVDTNDANTNANTNARSTYQQPPCEQSLGYQSLQYQPKILSKDLDYVKLSATLKTHVSNYGAAPNFEDFSTEKNKKKIHNYIKTALAMPKLTIDQAVLIASAMND